MSVRIFSASIQGIDAQLIEVEVDSAPGLHVFNIVGLPDKAVEESKDRIASALRNNNLAAPNTKSKKILVNLAPADVKKEGPSYDLPIALGYLLETKQVLFNPDDKLFTGELSLDGSLKPTSGILAMAILAKNAGFKEIIVPEANLPEASAVNGLKAIGAKHISEILSHLDGTRPIVPTPALEKTSSIEEENPFLHIKGQATAKRAIAIAAAGAHNVLMHGAPGSGKTLLAKALRYLLPPLGWEETIEVAKIYSSMGLLRGSPLSLSRPFRSPHHTASAASVVGGGTWPKPGEMSLAHRGVLFLDELPEFRRDVLESLRQPLEDGTATIARASGTITLPAKFTLIAAMNPCPCGNHGDDQKMCMCAPTAVLRYRKKVSGPLLDRIDIQISVPRETVSDSPLLKSEDLRPKIQAARLIQTERLKQYGLFTNSEIDYKTIDTLCNLQPSAETLLKYVINAKGLSLRAYHKVKRLARTVADLEQSDTIREEHIAEALSLRVNENFAQG